MWVLFLGFWPLLIQAGPLEDAVPHLVTRQVHLAEQNFTIFPPWGKLTAFVDIYAFNKIWARYYFLEEKKQLKVTEISIEKRKPALSCFIQFTNFTCASKILNDILFLHFYNRHYEKKSAIVLNSHDRCTHQSTQAMHLSFPLHSTFQEMSYNGDLLTVRGRAIQTKDVTITHKNCYITLNKDSQGLYIIYSTSFRQVYILCEAAAPAIPASNSRFSVGWARHVCDHAINIKASHFLILFLLINLLISLYFLCVLLTA